VLKILQPAAYISKIKHIQLGIRIRLCHSVEAVEITACLPDTIRFFNHMTIWRDRRCPWAVLLANYAILLQLVKLCLGGLQFCLNKAAKLSRNGQP
jgi:hypothetical protein